MRVPRAPRALAAAVLLLAGATLPAAAAPGPTRARGAEPPGYAAPAPERAAAPPSSASARTAAPAAASSRLSLALGGVSPSIARPGQSVTVSGTLTNRGSTAVARPEVRVVLGDADLASRRAVAAWATGDGAAEGRVVGRVRLRGTLAAGRSLAFRVTVPSAASLRTPAYGSLPLSVESGDAVLRTFAGYQRQKEYEPVRVAWVVPLTLDGRSDLFGGTQETRDAAWAAAVGPGSRIERVVAATESAPVTWAVDPTLVPSLLPAEVEDVRPEDDTGDATPTGDDARLAMEERIRATAGSHTTWVLPDTDADLAAVADTGGGTTLAGSLVARSAAVAESLGGRADIAWPADGRHTAARERALRRLFTEPRLAAQLARQSALPPGDGTQDAHRRSADGLPVLGFDDGLSALLAQTTTRANAALSTQRFIADSAALLDERPGTSGRSVLVAAPRSFSPDPVGASGLITTATAIPWLQQATTDELLRGAARATPMPKQVGTRPTSPPADGQSPGQPGPPAAPLDPYAASAPVLSRARLQNLQATLRTVRGVSLIREDGEAFARTWGRATEQLASVRWRAGTARAQWSALSREVNAAIDETREGITVSRSSINFLADTGRLQVRVVNRLGVAVQDVRLTLAPANPRLRIDQQPEPLRIGPGSRATAVAEVTALAAGFVPIRTTLTAPDGTVIGEGAEVGVRVTPTGNWFYWTLGGIAVVILLLGVWRSLRRRPQPRNAADPDPRGRA
jgi:hypothetical protein